MAKLPVTVLPGLVAYMDRKNKALIRHIGTSLSATELFKIIRAQNKFNIDDTSHVRLIEVIGRPKKRLIQQVVECAENIPQSPGGIDSEEYVDLLNNSDIYSPSYKNDDEEWIHMEWAGWFVKINYKE